ncbi:MAG: hypothetical protein SFW35_03220 [Chitinophagales bacterium]|nr:hypothetical protein [Chitinophagales bacterium]
MRNLSIIVLLLMFYATVTGQNSVKPSSSYSNGAKVSTVKSDSAATTKQVQGATQVKKTLNYGETVAPSQKMNGVVPKSSSRRKEVTQFENSTPVEPKEKEDKE